MLELLVNGHALELSADTKIELQFENPFCIADRVPVAHSMNFSIPNTASNMQLLGNPNRITSSVKLSAEYAVEIRFASIILASGAVKIEQVERYTTSLNFVGAIMPDSIRTHLQNQNFGKYEIGNYNIGTEVENDTEEARESWNNQLRHQARQVTPDYVAAVARIDGSKFSPTNETDLDVYLNLKTMYVNAYDHLRARYNFKKRREYFNSQSDTWEFAKILLSFRVGWILEHLLPGNNHVLSVFDNELASLMLVSNYHPSYNQLYKSPVWDYDTNARKVSVKYADYLPDISANEFIAELLKIICASLYIDGGNYQVILNKDILAMPCELDWTDKIIDSPVISGYSGEDYVGGFKNNKSQNITPVSSLTYVHIKDMVYDACKKAANGKINDSIKETYLITSTGQYFETFVDGDLSEGDNVHVGFKLLSTDLGCSSSTTETSTRNSFDMAVNGSAVECGVYTQLKDDHGYRPIFLDGRSLHGYWYCPIMAKPESRSADLVFGFYNGLRNINTYGLVPEDVTYPCLTHTGIAPDGVTTSNASLAWNGHDGLCSKYHSEYKEWISRDKKSVKVNVLLSPMDIHKLDLRRKVHVHGCNFYIKTLGVVLTMQKIEPANVEFIEA